MGLELNYPKIAALYFGAAYYSLFGFFGLFFLLIGLVFLAIILNLLKVLQLNRRKS